MARTLAHQTENNLEINSDMFVPLFESFFDRLTEKQWVLLKSGRPDDVTRLQLAELFLDIIIIPSRLLMISILHDEYESKTDVLLNLGDTLLLSFSRSLSIPEPIQNAKSKVLWELVTGQIIRCIEFNANTDEIIIASSRTLDSIVYQATKMFTNFLPSYFPPQMRHRRRRRLFPEEDEEDNRLVSANLTLTAAVQRELKKQLRVILGSILGELTDFSFQLLEFEVTQEVNHVSSIIAKELRTRTMQDLKCLLLSFFTQCFAKAWMYRIKAQVNCQCLILIKFSEESERRFRSIENIEEFFLHTRGMSKRIEIKTNEKRWKVIALKRKLWVFLSVTSWWWRTQLDKHSLISALILLDAAEAQRTSKKRRRSWFPSLTNCLSSS